MPGPTRKAGISACTCELLPGVLNDSTSFIYSGNENPNRLLLRCYNFLPSNVLTYVRTYVPTSRTYRHVVASPDIRYVIALGYGTNGAPAVKYRNEWISGSMHKLPAPPSPPPSPPPPPPPVQRQKKESDFLPINLDTSKRDDSSISSLPRYICIS